MITVKILITGLIGIVPQPDLGTVSLIAVDTLGAAQNAVPPIHIPLIASWKGICTGDCIFPLRGEDLDAKSSLGELIGELIDNNWINPGAKAFFWIPVERALDLSISSTGFPSRKTLLGVGNPATTLPTSADDVGFWRWIPQMGTLAADRARVNGRCLRGTESCSISSHIVVPFGALGACHLLGSEFFGESYVNSYSIVDSDTGRRNDQAIADYALIQFEVPGSSIVLESFCLDGHCRHRTATLKPEKGSREIVLLFGNMFLNPYSAQHVPHLEFLARLTGGAGPLGRPFDAYDKAQVPLTAPACEGLEKFICELNQSMAPVQPRTSIPLAPCLDPNSDSEVVVLEVPLNKPECGPIGIRN